MEPNIILVSGTPGTGKTTASRLLAARLHVRHIELTDYVRRNGLILSRDTARDTDVVDMKALQAALRQEPPEMTIIDGHFSPETVESRRVRAVIVLRRAPWFLKHELEKRGYHTSKVCENVEAELVGVCISEALAAQEKVHELDTTGKTPEQTVNEIREILEKGGHTPGEIDWLSHPEALKLIKELDECT